MLSPAFLTNSQCCRCGRRQTSTPQTNRLLPPAHVGGLPPLYRLVADHYDEFERVYPDRFQRHYGFWRPVIGRAVGKYLQCGDLRRGFARVRCPDCGYEMFVVFSCKQRGICPFCHQKRALTSAINIAENICAPVPHRQFVFTMPKRFRLYFRYNRELLRGLPVLAWQATLQVVRAVLAREDLPPGMIGAIRTHGQLCGWHPRLHCLTTYGGFTPGGTFIPLPDDLSTPLSAGSGRRGCSPSCWRRAASAGR